MDIWKLLLRGAAAVGGVAGLLLGLLVVFQDKMIYVPRIPGVPAEYPYTPDRFGLEYEDVWLSAADGTRLHAWLMWPRHWPRGRLAQRPLVVFFQENAGNMAFRLPFLQPLARALHAGVFVLSYRGYGASGGRPSEAGLKADAAAALAHLRARPDVDPAKIVLFGRSLGGAVAAHAAAADPAAVAAVVLENTFTNMEDVVPGVMPVLAPLVGTGRRFNFLLRSKWRTDAAVPRLAGTPVLFLSSTADEMLQPAQMRALYAAHGKAPWRFVALEGARHMDAYATHAAQYWAALIDFFKPLEERWAAAAGGGGSGDE